MPSPSFNRARPSSTAVAQKPPRGLTASIFSGIKEATAPNKEGKSLTKDKIMDQIKEINAQQWARQDVILNIATAIDSCLGQYTSKPASAVAEQIRSVLNTALENFVASHMNPTGRPKNPEKTGSNKADAQPTETMSANTSRSTKNKSNGSKNPTETGAPAATEKVDPKSSKVTWAQVASQDATHNEKTQKGSDPKKKPATDSEGPAPADNNKENKTKKTQEKPDDRIFIRVPPDHEWRKMSAIGARQEMIRTVKVTNADITYFQEVRSGFALRVRNQDIRNKIIALKPTAENNNLRIEEACPWKVFLVRGVSKTYTDMSGTHSTDTLIPEEARVRAGAKELPVAVHKAPFGESLDTCCYFISFKEDVKPGFKLFNNSYPAETRVQKPRITQCHRCLGFHNPRNCTRTERCLKCGKPSDKHTDTTANCPSPPQCANCNGPHRADSPKCPARPVIRDGEKVHATKDQLKAIRELGQKEYTETNPSKPAPAAEITPTNEALPEANPPKGGPRIRHPFPSSAPQPPARAPAQKVTIEVDSDDDPMDGSPARSEVHVAGSEDGVEDGDDDMEETTSKNDEPLATAS
ncbi:hypothetical protein TGAMA5MH_10771 [Trichoderma gamsii]|uniref:Uncharacterized protein n=1 Tax=Trichoderma gamsii TaxID=398673 RepID=A0A2K0SVM8_9HYPO|nr:hypothetical protein TGAMA5MH_10771 [Trichoderma gamsii]